MSNIYYTPAKEIHQDGLRRPPTERAHREEVVIPAVITPELGREVLKGIERVRGVKAFVVLAVAALDLAVVPGRERPDLLVADPVFHQPDLEEGRIVPGSSGEALGEFRTVIRLNTFDRNRKGLEQVFEEEGGGKGASLVKGFDIAPTGVFVDGGVLVELLTGGVTYEAGSRDKLDVDLDALSGIPHLLVRLRDVLGVRRFDSHDALAFEDAVEAGDGTLVAALHKLDPEDDEAGVWVSAAHIGDKFELLRGMLSWMAVRTSGTVAEGLPGTVVAVLPAVDLLAVDAVTDRGPGDAVLLGVLN